MLKLAIKIELKMGPSRRGPPGAGCSSWTLAPVEHSDWLHREYLVEISQGPRQISINMARHVALQYAPLRTPLIFPLMSLIEMEKIKSRPTRLDGEVSLTIST